MFGPEYHKIQTVWKRDERGVIMPGEFTLPELEYLADLPWVWTEKVDGTNIRLHWDGETVTVGGRTDNADVPAILRHNLNPFINYNRWRETFDSSDVTIYGEGYGAKIQSGGQYSQHQQFIVFDVKVDQWWLKDDDVEKVANQLEFLTVPYVAEWSLNEAWWRLCRGQLKSSWPDAQIEGIVGRPYVDLYNRKGERIIVKMKVKDWTDYQRRGGSNGD